MKALEKATKMVDELIVDAKERDNDYIYVFDTWFLDITGNTVKLTNELAKTYKEKGYRTRTDTFADSVGIGLKISWIAEELKKLKQLEYKDFDLEKVKECFNDQIVITEGNIEKIFGKQCKWYEIFYNENKYRIWVNIENNKIESVYLI